MQRAGSWLEYQFFRDVFGNYGAFYQHGEWICNATPYEFDYMGISEVNGENNGEVPIQTIDGIKWHADLYDRYLTATYRQEFCIIRMLRKFIREQSVFF